MYCVIWGVEIAPPHGILANKKFVAPLQLVGQGGVGEF